MNTKNTNAAAAADADLNAAVRDVLAAACAIDAAESALDDAIRAHGSAEGLVEGNRAWEAVHARRRELASAEERHIVARNVYDAAYRAYDAAMRAQDAAP